LLSENAHIIIFEKSDTSRSNSDYYPLTTKAIESIKNQQGH
jgi:hypothetical protein